MRRLAPLAVILIGLSGPSAVSGLELIGGMVRLSACNMGDQGDAANGCDVVEDSFSDGSHQVDLSVTRTVERFTPEGTSYLVDVAASQLRVDFSEHELVLSARGEGEEYDLLSFGDASGEGEVWFRAVKEQPYLISWSGSHAMMRLADRSDTTIFACDDCLGEQLQVVLSPGDYAFSFDYATSMDEPFEIEPASVDLSVMLVPEPIVGHGFVSAFVLIIAWYRRRRR